MGAGRAILIGLLAAAILALLVAGGLLLNPLPSSDAAVEAPPR